MNATTTTREQQLEAMLSKIVYRAGRARKAGNADIMLQDVPAALIEQALALLPSNEPTSRIVRKI